MIFTALTYTAFGIAQFVFETPRPEETWLEHFMSPIVFDGKLLAIPISAIGLAIDVYVIVLPILGVMRLQLSLR